VVPAKDVIEEPPSQKEEQQPSRWKDNNVLQLKIRQALCEKITGIINAIHDFPADYSTCGEGFHVNVGTGTRSGFSSKKLTKCYCKRNITCILRFLKHSFVSLFDLNRKRDFPFRQKHKKCLTRKCGWWVKVLLSQLTILLASCALYFAVFVVHSCKVY
jgi:hypothetical protein